MSSVKIILCLFFASFSFLNIASAETGSGESTYSTGCGKAQMVADASEAAGDCICTISFPSDLGVPRTTLAGGCKDDTNCEGDCKVHVIDYWPYKKNGVIDLWNPITINQDFTGNCHR